MLKLYSIFILLFIISSCASNVKVSDSEYNNVWVKSVKGKSVLAPNGYLYTFKENGDVEYKINGMKGGTGIFLYAESSTNAYYYEKMPLNYVAYDVRDSIPNSNVNMLVGFILNNGRLEMTSGYTKEYKKRLSDWKKNNLTIYNTLREGKDMSEYPIPLIEEVDNFNTIEFGTLR
ncbi:hypothetical protein [Brachyspira hampsonii]|uniref:Lipoprotein n=1 Tax=Brachyspira hampsonii TaxID=1287055 RepID=A0AAC9TRM1_9SPIR|nr:hypothetical protein [Brachyspira hampsonii]ASJ20665.1 hypothetical protein BHAMNSH16_02955 [Brachyspira hampsonii]MBW5381717.1 hypothetical protein [Brachyspira hampsonii]MBW5410695.1 hypothetical protein [Brachyspira hampsonii]OEJ18445.1 hypothetical protein A9496_08310 [Brachyspira hampsonii]